MSLSFEQNPDTLTDSETPTEEKFELVNEDDGQDQNGNVTAGQEDLKQALRDFLVLGGEEHPPQPQDQLSRELVLHELVAALSPSQNESDESIAQERQRARQLFIEYGFLDKAIDDLRMEGESSTRAAAAKLLGLIRSERGTAPLIAALFDDAEEVREAATAALSEIGDPAVSIRRDDEPHDTSSTVDAELFAGGENWTSISHPVPWLAESQTSDESMEDPDLIRQKIESLEAQLLEAIRARSEAEREVRLRIEQEATLRAEAAARRRDDEETRKRTEEKATRRRYEDERKLASEQLGLARAEIEAQDLAEKETRLRLEAFTLRNAAEAIIRQQAQAQSMQLAASHAAELAEAEAALKEATEQHTIEIDRLRREEGLLRTASADAALRRSEVEAERRRNEIDTQQLLEEQARLAAADVACREEAERVREAEAKLRTDQAELVRRAEELRRLSEAAATRRHELDVAQHRAQEEEQELYDLEIRTQAAADSRRQAQSERMRLESEIRQRLQSEQHLLEEARARAIEQEEILAEAARLRTEEYERRRAELETLRERLEADMQRRTEQEAEFINRIEGLRTAEAEMRKRIEELESQRGNAERSHGLVAEQLQRMETEARVSSTEEQRALAKLEEVRRNISQQVQSLSDQQNRVKKEIESLRKTEEEQRKRLDLEIQRRADLEIRLQHDRERLRIAEEVRVKAESQVEFLTNSHTEITEVEWHDDPTENLRQIDPASSPAVVDAAGPGQGFELSSQPAFEEPAAVLSEDEVLAKLNSSESSERVQGLAALPALEIPDRFNLIVKYFDDGSEEVRNAAARSLHKIEPLRPVDPFTRALEEASSERRRNIGLAIASSGLAAQSLNDLDADSREDTYNALCLLFVMAKTGQVQPLVEAIESHPDVEVRRAAIKLLNLSGQSELAEQAAKRRLGLGRSHSA